MARLPRPGGDTGSWGDILNNYLKTSHNDDGTLKNNIVTESKLSSAVRSKLNSSASGSIADGSVTAAKLADNAVTSSKIAPSSVTDAKIATGISQSKISGLGSALSGKANSDHTHSVSGVTGLQSALDDKASTDHSHSLGDLSNVDVDDATDGQALVLQSGQWRSATLTGGDGSGVTDHGALTGLGDDDHPQYLNQTRGDARYYTKSQVDDAIGDASGAVSSVAGKTGAVTLEKGDVGLGNVDNTSDTNKPVSSATQDALDLKANANAVVGLVGNQAISGVKTFSSSPIVPSPTSNNQAANKQYVDTAVAGASGGGGVPTLNATVRTSNYTASPGDFVVSDASSGGFTVTLPAPDNGVWVKVKKQDNSVNAVLVRPPGQDDQIHAGPMTSVSISVNVYGLSYDFFADGERWHIA